MYTRDLPVEIGCTVSHNKLEYFLCVLWNFCIFFGVFWLNITKFKVNWCYRYCFKLFSNLRKEKELRQYHCRNSTKVGERKIKSRREQFLIFCNGIAAIPSAHSTARVGARNVSARKENQMSKKNVTKSVKE